jgi:hypothetical protein
MGERTLARLRLGDVPVADEVDGSDLDPNLSPRPYLHPVRTLGGTVVTDALPADHRWHLGISVALQDVEGWNFWGGRTYVRGQGYVWRGDHGRIEHAGFARLGDGLAQLRARCPAALLGSCTSSYRLRIPDNVPVTVRTTGGDVTSSGYRGSATVDTRRGSVDFDGWCGNSLQIRADSGDVRAVTSCPPQRLQLRSRTGSVDALVPPGRYRIDADSDEGSRTVRGLTAGEDAPFSIQALSTSGDVHVGSGP